MSSGHVGFPLGLEEPQNGQGWVKVSACLGEKGMSRGELCTVISKDTKLTRLMGIPLKAVAWWMYNYCPKLPRLDWNIVVIQIAFKSNHACLLLPC